ncbi:hypothetical protein K1719_045952 [Acacia pycnantha]|nr:hypothetical protein K1719_045952 [Acacia pycnantha]
MKPSLIALYTLFAFIASSAKAVVIWRAEEDGVKSVKISGYGNTITGVFQIQKYTNIGYKIVFCPTDGDSCGDIGLSSRGLVITDDIPLGLIFVKVESSEVSKQVINNVLEA